MESGQASKDLTGIIDDQIMEMIKKEITVDYNDQDNEEGGEYLPGKVKSEMMLTCCVPGCGRRFIYNSGYRFRVKDKRQTHFWLKVLGKDWNWQPTRFDRICKFHFIGNRASSRRNMINYIPTKIPAPKLMVKDQMYKSFRMSYCWNTGWTITKERGDDYRKVSNLLRLCWNQTFKDCRVVCKGGDFIYCHSVILAMSSPILKKLLLPQEAEETKVIMLPDFSITSVKSLIRHCYCLDTIPEKGLLLNEIIKLMSFLRVKGVLVEAKKSNRLAIKRAKKSVVAEPHPQPEYELSKEAGIILVSHQSNNGCCSEFRPQPLKAAIKCNPADPKFMELKDLQEFLISESIAYPDCVTERSVKHGYVLDDEGKVNYRKISSTVTLKTRRVIVGRVGQETSKGKPVSHVVKNEQLPMEDSVEEVGALLGPEMPKFDSENDNVGPLKERNKKTMVLNIKGSSEIPCSFQCVTCDAKIISTISQHNALLSKVNGEMGNGCKQDLPVIYQCLKCQQNGLKPSKDVEKKSWGFIQTYLGAKKKNLKLEKQQLKVKHKDGGVLCSMCGLHCKSNQYLEWHMNMHKGETPFACDSCDKAFPYPSSLAKHRRSVHGKPCPLCQEIIVCLANKTDVESLEIHKKEHHSGNESFKCDQCTFGSKTKKEIASHVTRCHSSSCDRIQCDRCPAILNRLIIARHHKMHHDPKLPFECNQCQFRSISETGIIAHKGRHHTTNRITCGNGCGQTFSKAMTMRWHMKRFCSKSTVKEDMKKRENEIGMSDRKKLRAAKSKERNRKKYNEIFETSALK